jgi:hypothetical protein
MLNFRMNQILPSGHLKDTLKLTDVRFTRRIVANPFLNDTARPFNDATNTHRISFT